MTEQATLKRLAEIGALITDSHVVYTSGKHGSAYVNKDAIYPHTSLTSSLCRRLAEHFTQDDPITFAAVVAPAVGGIALSQWTAHHLSVLSSREVLALYAEKQLNGLFALTRGYARLVQEHTVLVVEDVLNTGGSAVEVVRAVRASGGHVPRVAALCNRGGVRETELTVEALYALVNVTLDVWDEAKCPLCAKGIPINTEVGHGKDFLARRALAAAERAEQQEFADRQ